MRRRPIATSRAVAPRDRPCWCRKLDFGRRSAHRQTHDEARAGALALALRLDRPGVQLHQVMDDRESQSEAAVAPPDRAVLLAEALEDVRQELRLDPLARVGDGDLQVLAAHRELHVDAPAGSRELDGVGKKVAEDLLQT